jgi:hypothetical protein
MRTQTCGRWLLICLAALLIPLAALGSSACGSAVEADAAAPLPQAAAASPATLDVAGTLLVVRRQEGAWKLVRLTPASGVERVLGALPFKPREALASPSGARVLYVGERARLAVVDAATGAVQSISVAGRPIRAIDGATWTGEDRFLFGGSRTVSASPERGLLYRADVASGKVTRFRHLSGGEPSYASEQGSLIYVTRRVADGKGTEAIWRLRSLTSRRPQRLDHATTFVDAGRSFTAPLVSPDGAYVLSADTGTDVSVTYSLINVDFLAMTMWQIRGGSPNVAAWGGSKAAFMQSLPSDPGGKPATFIYDAASCSLAPHSSPWFTSLDWSAQGDLVGGAWVQDSSAGAVYAAAASDLGTWVNLGAGLVPVWVQ